MSKVWLVKDGRKRIANSYDLIEEWTEVFDYKEAEQADKFAQTQRSKPVVEYKEVIAKIENKEEKRLRKNAIARQRYLEQKRNKEQIEELKAEIKEPNKKSVWNRFS